MRPFSSRRVAIQSLTMISAMLASPACAAGASGEERGFAPGVSASMVVAATETLSRYARGVDEIDGKEVANSMTKDGVIEVWMGGKKTQDDIVGADVIGERMVRGRIKQGSMRRHAITNVYAEKFDGNSLVLRSYFTIVVTSGNSVTTQSTGAYIDTMVQERDGFWRTAHKKIVLDSAYQ